MAEPAPPKLKPRKQVAALPVMVDAGGTLQVMLVTSRETKRLIIPKGWPMKGRKDHRAAAIEAREEAGLIGRIHRKPIGSYTYWKRREAYFLYCLVKVFVLEVIGQLPDWRERGQRRGLWLPVDAAADLVDDPGLVTIIRDLAKVMRPRKKRRRVAPDGLDPALAASIRGKERGRPGTVLGGGALPQTRKGDVRDA